MTVTGDTGGKGTKAIANRYPVTSGLTAGTTKQTGRVMNLVPQASTVSRRRKVGLNGKR